MGLRGPQKNEASNTGMVSIRVPVSVQAEIKAIFTTDELRKALIKAVTQKRLQISKKLS